MKKAVESIMPNIQQSQFGPLVELLRE